MIKGIGIKTSGLFTDDEQLEIQQQFKNNNIEVIFFGKNQNQIQASFDSVFELILNVEFLEELALAITVDLLKDLIINIVTQIKKKKVVVSNKRIKPAKLTIKSTTEKGTIYLEVPNDISDKGCQEAIGKIVEAKKILDNSSRQGINDLFIVEDKLGNLSIMTLSEYIIYRKNQK